MYNWMYIYNMRDMLALSIPCYHCLSSGAYIVELDTSLILILLWYKRVLCCRSRFIILFYFWMSVGILYIIYCLIEYCYGGLFITFHFDAVGQPSLSLCS